MQAVFGGGRIRLAPQALSLRSLPVVSLAAKRHDQGLQDGIIPRPGIAGNPDRDPCLWNV